jgi:hypothetical protein
MHNPCGVHHPVSSHLAGGCRRGRKGTQGEGDGVPERRRSYEPVSAIAWY